jgi:hypothetical protein
VVESTTPRSIGALDGSLPQVLLAGGNRKLAGQRSLGWRSSSGWAENASSVM